MRTDKEVDELARGHLELNDEEEIPPVYLSLLTRFLRHYPNDTNFLAEQGGGNGFGVVTCLEDFCWKDIMLDADPSPDREKGGKKDGFGSFFNLEEHCKDSDHVRGRDQRLQRSGITPLAASTSPLASNRAAQATSPSNAFASSSRQSNRKPANILSALDGIRARPSTSYTPSLMPDAAQRVAQIKQELAQLDPNLASANYGREYHSYSGSSQSPTQDKKPFSFPAATHSSGSGTRQDALYVDSDTSSSSSADSDGVELLSEAPEGMKKVTNEHDPFVISDDSEDEAGPSGSASRIQAMSYQERVKNAKMERDFLDSCSKGTLRNQLSLQQHMAARERQQQLNELIANAGLGLYERPRPLLMSIPGMSAFVDPWERTGLCPPASAMEVEGMARTTEQQQILGDMASQRQQILSAGLNGRDLGALPYEERQMLIHNVMSAAENIHGQSPEYSLGRSPSRSTSTRPAPSLGMPGMPGAFPALGAGIPAPGPNGMSYMPGNSLNALSSSSTSLAQRYEEYGEEYDRPRDAQSLAEFFQHSMEDFQEDTTVEQDLASLGLKALDAKLPGMRVSLMPHQVIGVAWMLRKEKAKRMPGGILGDEMGLGKTIQTIATIVANPSKDSKIRTTLVIVPLALLRQWRLEIEEKSNLKVGVYHNSVEKVQSKSWMRAHDVVLTTLGTLNGERGGELAPKKKKKKKRADSFVSEDEQDEPVIKPKGILFKNRWYRVVLDEVAAIRNRNSIGSKAVVGLDSHINWALTGTLVYNSLADIYPLLRFTKAADWKDFHSRISKFEKRKPKLASSRAQALLKGDLLRRTKQSELNGQKLLNLPEKTVILDYLHFSPDELALYRSVEQRARLRVNKWLKRGDNVKTWRCAFVLLTRLRQLCDHPYLLRAQAGQIGDDVLQVTDEELFGGLQNVSVDNKEEVDRAERMMGPAWVADVKEKLKQRNEAATKQRGAAKKEEPEGGQDEVNMECPICYDLYQDERITGCKHSFCAACIEDVFNSAPREAQGYTDEQVQRDVRTCPLCRSEMASNTVFRADAFLADPENEEEEEEEEELKEDMDIKPDINVKGKKRLVDVLDGDTAVSRRKKGKGKARQDPDEDDDELASEPDEKPEFINGLENIPPSSKLERSVQILEEWHQADPSQKVLCFSSFVQYLELVSAHLRTKGIKHELYTGKMKQEEREEVIRDFSTRDGPNTTRVLLISLKCGGVGLNLTRANLVICLDLAWSPASENQAVDRAHRIGQTRPVEVRRLIVHDSVEERMLALQERKQALADGAMGEGNGAKLGRMTLRELISLFGSDRDFERE